METKQAILYFRTSGETLKSNKGFGLADQKADCEAYCKDNGLEIVNTFCDDGCSGSDQALDQSHALLEMLSSLNGGDVHIVTKNSDRLMGRGEYRSAWVRREIIKSGKKLICTDNPAYDIYSDDPSTTLMNKIFDAVAIFEKMTISLRLAKSRRAKVRNGMKASGPAPFGYTWEDIGSSRELVIDEAKADMVREMFRMAIGGRSCGNIATHFDLEYGLKISRARIYGILTNETYIGKMKYGSTEAMNESLALIPKITFGKAKASLGRRKK